MTFISMTSVRRCVDLDRRPPPLLPANAALIFFDLAASSSLGWPAAAGCLAVLSISEANALYCKRYHPGPLSLRTSFPFTVTPNHVFFCCPYRCVARRCSRSCLVEAVLLDSVECVASTALTSSVHDATLFCPARKFISDRCSFAVYDPCCLTENSWDIIFLSSCFN